MVFLLGVDAPDALAVSGAGDYRAGGVHRRQHGVIHVVVAVLAVSAYAVEIIEAVEVPAHLPELLVGAEVRRVGLLHLGGEAVCDVLALYYADLLQLL